ncbi:MAG: LptF/LptG family permease [Treponema sp.]|nr:LptF/LptG family permease [Treponema sp.]
MNKVGIPIQLRFKTLYVYITKELLLYFGILFLFFFAIFFLNQILLLAESILKKHVPLWDVVRLITYCLPVIIAQSAPFATLVGFLMCIGAMMSNNEILVIRASGFSFHVILLPVLITGLLISVFSFFVNDYLLPVGNIRYIQMRRQIAMSNPVIELEPHAIKRFNDSIVVIGDVDGTHVSDVVLFNFDEDGRQQIIVSGVAEIDKSKQEGIVMTMHMSDAMITTFGNTHDKSIDVLRSDSLFLHIFDDSVFDGTTTVSPGDMTSYDLGKEIQRMKREENTPSHKKIINRYILEYNKKFSLPFGSLFFAVLAFPLAILFGKRNGQMVGFVLGLILCVFYWACMILGQIFSSKSGVGGMFSMWLPDIMIGISGALLYVALIRR